MRLHTPAQLEGLTGLSTGAQRSWRLSGYLDGIGVQTPGGQWRFSALDVLAVAAIQAVADIGFGLGPAAMLAKVFQLEIEGAVTGKPRVHPQRRFALAWKECDCTPQAEAALPQNVICLDRNDFDHLHQDCLTIHRAEEWCAVQSDHTEDLPRLSRAGGVVIIPADLARKIPSAVTALFLEAPA